MPIYEYLCPKCSKVHERIFKVTDFPEVVKCKFCGAYAHKIISAGAIQTDNDATWLPSAIKTLQPDHERPITTRTEYKKYLKDKGITPIG